MEKFLDHLMAFEKSLCFDRCLATRTGSCDRLTVVRILNISAGKNTWDIRFWATMSVNESMGIKL
jgi:hypothetical protein